MKRMEKLTRIVLGFLVLLAVVAIVLQIVNQETNLLETVYEIITFMVAVVALMLTITQGIANARTIEELKEIMRTTNRALKMEEETEKLNEAVMNEMKTARKTKEQSQKLLRK